MAFMAGQLHFQTLRFSSRFRSNALLFHTEFHPSPRSLCRTITILGRVWILRSSAAEYSNYTLWCLRCTFKTYLWCQWSEVIWHKRRNDQELATGVLCLYFVLERNKWGNFRSIRRNTTTYKNFIFICPWRYVWWGEALVNHVFLWGVSPIAIYDFKSRTCSLFNK